jgi:hypothetical protein
MPFVGFEHTNPASEWPHTHARGTGLINSYGINRCVERCFTVPGIRQCFNIGLLLQTVRVSPGWLLERFVVHKVALQCIVSSFFSSALLVNLLLYHMHLPPARLVRRVSLLCIVSLRWEGFITSVASGMSKNERYWEKVRLSLCMLWKCKGGIRL